MVEIIAGEKGTGKTKTLITKANDAALLTSGSIVFLDKNNKHMYELSNQIRLIVVPEFNVTDTDMAVDHSWDTDAANQIKATGTKYSYANYAGLIQVNSQKEFNSLLNSFVKNKTKHFELASNTTIDIKSGFNTLNVALTYSYKNVSRNGQMIYIINITY